MALPVRRNTAVAQWDPFRELDDFHTRMNRLMESAFGGFAGLDELFFDHGITLLVCTIPDHFHCMIN